jgi:hypothetical protein
LILSSSGLPTVNCLFVSWKWNCSTIWLGTNLILCVLWTARWWLKDPWVDWLNGTVHYWR